MRKLFQLVGEISVTGIDLLNKQLWQIDREARKVQRSIVTLGKNIEKTGLALTKSITTPLVGLGAAMVLAADKTGKYADKLLSLKDITGLSTDSLQEFEHVARIAGVDFDGLTNTIIQFTRKLPQIAKEGGFAYDSIKKLGINIYDANGNIRDMNQLFPKMLKALMNVENVTERNAMTTTIFGRSLNDLAPVLSMTAEGFDAAVKEAHDLNLVLGEDGLNAANDYRIEMEKLKAEFTKFWQRMAIDFIPIFKDTLIPMMRSTLIPLFEKTIKIVKSVADWFTKLPEPVRETIIQIAAMAAVAGPFLMILGKMIIATKALTTAILAQNVAMLANPYVLAAAAIMSVGAAIYYTIKAHEEFKKSFAENIKNDQIEKAKKYLEEIIPLYGKLALPNVSEDGFQSINKHLKELETNLADLGYTFEGNFGKRAVEAENALTDLRETITETTDTTDDSTKSLLENADAEEKDKKAKEQANKIKQEQIQLEKESIQQRISETNNIRIQAQEKLKLLDIEEKEALESAVGGEESKQKIRELYNHKRIQLENETTDAIIALSDKAVEAEEKANEERGKALEEKKEKLKEFFREWKKEEDELHEVQIQSILNVAQAMVEMNSYISSIIDNFYQKQFNLLDAKEQKEIDNINKSVMNEENKASAISTIQKKYDTERKKIMREQAKKDKAFALFGAIVNTAGAIVAALNASGPMWYKIMMAIIVGAMGAAQIAVIASQPLPLARGGLIKSGKGGIQAEIGEGTEDEMVLPMKTGVQVLADALMDKLSEFKIPTFAPQQQLAMAGGGTLTTGSGYRGGDINLHIGTLVADDSGLKELERRLYKLRASEDQRKGRANYGYR